MSSAAERLRSKYGANLGESLGVRTSPVGPAEAPAVAFHGETADPEAGRTRARNAGHMEIDRISPDPKQPRKEFEPGSIERLAASIRKHGQLLPVRLRWDEDFGRWVIVSGERRYRAAALAGLKTLACIFVEGEPDPAEILVEQLIENVLREDLKPVELATAYRQLMELNGWTAKELSAELHVSPASVSRTLALLDLPADMQSQVDAGELPASAAYELARADEQTREAVAARIRAGEMTRDDAAQAVRVAKGKGKGRGASRPVRPVKIRLQGATVTVEISRRNPLSVAEALRRALAEVEGRESGEAAA